METKTKIKVDMRIQMLFSSSKYTYQNVSAQILRKTVLGHPKDDQYFFFSQILQNGYFYFLSKSALKKENKVLTLSKQKNYLGKILFRFENIIFFWKGANTKKTSSFEPSKKFADFIKKKICKYLQMKKFIQSYVPKKLIGLYNQEKWRYQTKQKIILFHISYYIFLFFFEKAFCLNYTSDKQ
ncbi:hypothetical protein RFI_20816 [Reticulomyxa filosa]|uniref:Uncharacterized protein n=1 Tax=Reticulomyxa filosa TaxID=46433 RepID=X6MTT4_RETFI|nr:hypothetical protein RFI_20816 [Reticulomyxa filosa]|eukprot:ETO16525.1 hypothetical protein RFI_20816 [Reticulomyxa filosa]